MADADHPAEAGPEQELDEVRSPQGRPPGARGGGGGLVHLESDAQL